MGLGQTAKLPLIPLPKDSVLLPGLTLRIPVANRPDIPILLSSAFTKATSSRRDASSLSVGCVPLNSPFLSRDGQQLLDSKVGESGTKQERIDINPGKASKDDLFTYGTVAKIVGVQGRPSSQPYLLVEGVRRFRIDRFAQERPYFEAEVTYYDEEGGFYDV